MYALFRTIAAFAVAAVLGFGLAQGMADATVELAESDAHGPHLVSASGFALYLFSDEALLGEGPERRTEGVREAAVPCTGDCLGAWPAVTSETAPVAGEGLDPELLYVDEIDGREHVVYDGWPLYTFARDQEPGQTSGHAVTGFGGTWYLVTPSGTTVGHDDGMDGDSSARY